MNAGSALTRQPRRSGARSYLIATVAPILVTSLVTPVVTRTVGSTAYGEVATAISATQLAQVLFTVGLVVPISRTSASAQLPVSDGHRTLTAAVQAVLLMGLATFAVVFTLGRERLGPIGWLPYVVAAASTQATFLCVQAYRRGREQVLQFMIGTVVLSVSAPLSGLAAVLFADAGASRSAAYFAGYTFAVTAISLLTCVAVCGPNLLRRQGIRLKSILAEALPTTPHALVSASIVPLAVMFAAANSHALAGEMQLAITIGSAPTLLLLALNNGWAIRVIKQPTDERNTFVGRSAVTMVVVMAALAIGAGIAAPVGAAWLGSSTMDGETIRIGATFVATSAPLAVAYLAAINLRFATARTRVVALVTPINGLVALATPTLVSHIAGPPDWIYVLSIPLFQAMQSWTYFLMDRRTTEGQLLRCTILGSAAAATVPLTLFLNGILWFVAAFLCMAVSLYLFGRLRRKIVDLA